jgi:hypothetical protein
VVSKGIVYLQSNFQIYDARVSHSRIHMLSHSPMHRSDQQPDKNKECDLSLLLGRAKQFSLLQPYHGHAQQPVIRPHPLGNLQPHTSSGYASKRCHSQKYDPSHYDRPPTVIPYRTLHSTAVVMSSGLCSERYGKVWKRLSVVCCRRK